MNFPYLLVNKQGAAQLDWSPSAWGVCRNKCCKYLGAMCTQQGPAGETGPQAQARASTPVGVRLSPTVEEGLPSLEKVSLSWVPRLQL